RKERPEQQRMRSMSSFKLSSCCVCLHLEDSRGREKIPTVVTLPSNGTRTPEAADARHETSRVPDRNHQSTISPRGEIQHTYGAAFPGFRSPSRWPTEASAARQR